MSFDLIAISALLAGWMACGLLVWLALSVATRGEAGLAYLPLSMVVSVISGMLVPVLGGIGVTGLWLSFLAAIAGPAALLLIRRFSLGASREVGGSRAEAGRSRTVDAVQCPESPE